jgi:hypothetical protein
MTPVAAAALVLGATQSDAGRVDLDVNAISVDAAGTFDSEFTGTLEVTPTNDTQLVSIFVQGDNRLDADVPATVFGQINLLNGTVTGGFLDLVVMETEGPDALPTPGDRYRANVRSNSGIVVQAINDGDLYQLGGMTFDGEFTDADEDGLFAGVDLGDLPFDEELPGNFLVLDYEPDSTGQDVADIEFRAVPLPSAALLGAPLVLGLPILRRKLSR